MTKIQYFDTVLAKIHCNLRKMARFQIFGKFSNPRLIPPISDYHMTLMIMPFVIVDRVSAIELLYEQNGKQMCQEILPTASK